MKTINLAVLPFTILAAAMVGGCVGAEPDDELETMTEGELGDGAETATEDEPGDGTEAVTEDEPTAQDSAALLTGWNEQMFTDDPFPYGGRVRFKGYGDHVELCDVHADGKGVSLSVSLNGQHKYSMSVGGVGNCILRNNSYGGVYNLQEGAVYKFVICLSGNWCDEAFWHNNK